MARPHGADAAGRPLNLIGQPLDLRHASPAQPFIVTKEDAMPKAESNGVYTIGGHRFKVRKGDPVPEGAEFASTEAKSDEAQEDAQRARGAAPENKAKTGAPEQKRKDA